MATTSEYATIDKAATPTLREAADDRPRVREACIAHPPAPPRSAPTPMPVASSTSGWCPVLVANAVPATAAARK